MPTNWQSATAQLLSPLDSPVHSPSSSRKNLLDTEPDEKLDAATVEGCVMDYTLQFDLYDQIERWFHERLLDEVCSI
ncbi:hypothetical protein SARC_13555 [Sphaeroforma arctica JP610]|uniref:Uncharacterized protein n=1 Tax=Sphaeroforma arctica JP610 TaxID=667725 RepID=A0A0L0FBK7_9EUKA|nr:hypothetical protein SARC_13555 [Sphaeroforma arctica JP610]KNC73886.1 hypothetical protein SARC_13555 [Sphaeroforma arctica JP610]|eukprot:XP_014147788.1 hypothetical protein SARC_13555 [Sphaeroforma arctica JP610]